MGQWQRLQSGLGHDVGHAGRASWPQQSLYVTLSLRACEGNAINAALTVITTRAIRTTVDAARNNMVFADDSANFIA
ncbi:hypothetical protein RW64_08525 [Geobacter sulfurreducens]|nr:hypothetical protein RW64_08525 [Geobacter sulfurreducens]